MKIKKEELKPRLSNKKVIRSGIYGINASKSSVTIKIGGSDLTGTVK